MLLLASDNSWFDIVSTKRFGREASHVKDRFCSSSDYIRRDASLVTGHPRDRRAGSAGVLQSDWAGRPTPQFCYVGRRSNVLSSQVDR